MDIVCKSCSAKFKIPDEKLPQKQAFSISCPKCKKKIAIDTRAEAAAPTDASDPAAGFIMDESDVTGDYDAEDKPFDFLEEGAETALLCQSEPDLRAKIRQALESLGYQIREAKTPIDALKQMRFHVFDIVVLDEMFGTSNPDENNVLRFLCRLSMDIRRNMIVMLITERFRTNDNMSAFHKSVNIVINRKNIDDFKKIAKRTVAEHAAIYRVFRESLIKTGRS